MSHTIYFLRHGQTDWNARKRLQGQLDIPMNETGLKQVRANGQKLATLLPEPDKLHYVSSPLGRAMETMRIVRRALGLPEADFATHDRLKEISFGRWQGKTWDELRISDPATIERRFADKWGYRAPGGESYAMLSARALDWYDSVKRDTVVTAHGGVSRVLRGHLLGQDPRTIPQLDAPQDKVLLIRDDKIDWL